MKRCLCAILTAIMLLFTLVACNESTYVGGTPDAQISENLKDTGEHGTELLPGQPESGEETKQTQKRPDKYDEVWFDGTVNFTLLDFYGENITVLVREDIKASREWEKEVIDDNDALDLAIKERNRKVEKDLNVKVNVRYVVSSNGWRDGTDWHDSFMPIVQRDINNDLNEIDITANYGFYGMSAAYRDCWANLLDKDTFPFFRFDLPCWNQSIYENGTVNGRLYVCASDMNISMFDSAMILWHNKSLYQRVRGDEDPRDIQDVAIEGKWVYSELYKWSQYYDHNDRDNGGNIYGISMNGTRPTEAFAALPYAWDIDLTKRNAKGSYSFNIIGNTEAEQGLTVLRDMLAQDGVVDERIGVGNFTSGNSLFRSDVIYEDKVSNAAMRNMTDRYALLPWPKLNDTDYYYATTAQEYFTTMSVVTHSADDKGIAVSAYLEHATEHSYTYVRSSYLWNIVLPELHSTEDPDGYVTKSIALFNVTVENLEYDFATIYGPMLGDVMTNVWRNNVIDGNGNALNTTVKSAFEDNREDYEAALDSLDTWFGLVTNN